MLGMLNATLPRLYASGDWRALKAEYEVDVSSGYFCLLPDHECVLSASLMDMPMRINSIDYQTQVGGPGTLMDYRPVGGAYGLIDAGMSVLMSELPELGADEFIFTCASAAFAAGSSTSITSAATYAGGSQTNMLVSSSTGFAVGMRVTISGASAGVEDYNGSWRVTAVPDSTHIAIAKVFTATLTGTVASAGDTMTITYTDTEEGYTQVVLPLHTITAAASGATAIVTAASGGTDAVTGEILTTITTVTSTTGLGLVAGLGLTLSQLTGTDATYIGTFRIHSIPSSSSIKIVKAYVALTGTLAAVTAPRLMPVNTIESVESIIYASLPGRTMMKDADGIIYGIYQDGDGASSFRRYDCPQVPEDADDDDQWAVKAIVKRAFVPLTATTDLVYLDSIPALTAAFLAVVARDASDHAREAILWREAIKILSDELFDTKGGVQQIPNIQLWGEGIPGLCSSY